MAFTFVRGLIKALFIDFIRPAGVKATLCIFYRHLTDPYPLSLLATSTLLYAPIYCWSCPHWRNPDPSRLLAGPLTSSARGCAASCSGTVYKLISVRAWLARSYSIPGGGRRGVRLQWRPMTHLTNANCNVWRLLFPAVGATHGDG